MWFKNLKIYRLTPHWADHAAELSQALLGHRFVSADDLSATSQGWVPARETDDRLAVDVAGQYLLKLRLEKKLLPAAVINQTVKARAAELEAEQGWRPGRKQLRDIKEAVTDQLLPRAFSVARDIAVWVDPVHQWLVVDAAAAAQADEVLSALGKSLNPYPVEPLRLEHSVSSLMTDWLLSDQAPAGFQLEADSQWQTAGDAAGVIRYVRHPLTPEAIAQHVAAGYQCVRLAMTWQDRISFVLTDTADIKRVTALDILEEKTAQAGAITPEEKLDTDFTLMTAELHQLLTALMAVLGEQREAQT
jgi:recombination associated protein RdgC